MKVSEAAILMDAEAEPASAKLFDNQISDFSIDSRSLKAGELFFALSGEDYARAGFNGTFVDAHEFISDALLRGAVAAVARRDRVLDDPGLTSLRSSLLLVDDAIVALQKLAHRLYERWAQPVVGITGSAGKTTAKELTSHLLSRAGGRRVLKSERNYNNGLGLPLSVLKMVSAGHSPDQYDTAVLEMGMSSPTHEIERLCRITPPEIGVVLMVAPVHLEYLGTIERIAAAKAELISGLKQGGTAVLNADDEWVIKMRENHAGPIVTFGIDQPSDVSATEIDSRHLGQVHFRLKTPLGEASAILPMSGRHNLMNALAAAAVATCFQIGPEKIASALESVSTPQMRGEVIDFAAGFTVIDDSYNSNPRSLLSMARTMAESRAPHKRLIVIAGEMLELGPDASALHRESGQQIAREGIDVVWGVRGLAQELVVGAKEAGVAETRFFPSSEDAAREIVSEAREGDLILVKGSRGVATDTIVAAVRTRFPQLGDDD